MTNKNMKELQSPEEIPQFSSEAEEAEFWATHSLGESFPDLVESWPEDILPSVRSETNRAQSSSRDWQQEVRDMVEDYGELLQEEDLDPIASSLVAKNSANLLVEISKELQSISKELLSLSKRIRAASNKKGFSPKKMQEMIRSFEARRGTYDSVQEAYYELEPFVVRAIESHKARFEDDPNTYSVVEEAERILEALNQ